MIQNSTSYILAVCSYHVAKQYNDTFFLSFFLSLFFLSFSLFKLSREPLKYSTYILSKVEFFICKRIVHSQTISRITAPKNTE